MAIFDGDPRRRRGTVEDSVAVPVPEQDCLPG